MWAPVSTPLVLVYFNSNFQFYKGIELFITVPQCIHSAIKAISHSTMVQVHATYLQIMEKYWSNMSYVLRVELRLLNDDL